MAKNIGTLCKYDQRRLCKLICIVNCHWSLVFGDEFVAHLKSNQRCSAAFCRPVKFFHTD